MNLKTVSLFSYILLLSGNCIFIQLYLLLTNILFNMLNLLSLCSFWYHFIYLFFEITLWLMVIDGKQNHKGMHFLGVKTWQWGSHLRQPFHRLWKSSNALVSKSKIWGRRIDLITNDLVENISLYRVNLQRWICVADLMSMAIRLYWVNWS